MLLIGVRFDRVVFFGFLEEENQLFLLKMYHNKERILQDDIVRLDLFFAYNQPCLWASNKVLQYYFLVQLFFLVHYLLPHQYHQ